MNLSQFLSGYAQILNKTGPESQEGEDFVKAHAENPEFVRLARLSASLKRALMPAPVESVKGETVPELAPHEAEQGI